jgi:hypothetical protein
MNGKDPFGSFVKKKCYSQSISWDILRKLVFMNTPNTPQGGILFNPHALRWILFNPHAVRGTELSDRFSGVRH